LVWFHARCTQSRARATVGVEDSASWTPWTHCFAHHHATGFTFSYYIRRGACPLDSLQFPTSPPASAGDQHTSFLSCSYRSALELHRSALFTAKTAQIDVGCLLGSPSSFAALSLGHLDADTPPPPSCPNLRRDARLCQPQKRRHHLLSSARRADSDPLSFDFTPQITSILALRALKSCTTLHYRIQIAVLPSALYFDATSSSGRPIPPCFRDSSTTTTRATVALRHSSSSSTGVLRRKDILRLSSRATVDSECAMLCEDEAKTTTGLRTAATVQQLRTVPDASSTTVRLWPGA
jgi:hypothetical protein